MIFTRVIAGFNTYFYDFFATYFVQVITIATPILLNPINSKLFLHDLS